jgi:hypothetical protein
MERRLGADEFAAAGPSLNGSYIRLAEERIGETADYGTISYISNSSYLTGRSHPLMRRSLLSNFHAVWIDKKFEDDYENALKELLKKKQAGQPVELPERREPACVINLMDALRQSVEASRSAGKPPAPSAEAREAKREPSRKPKSRRAS